MRNHIALSQEMLRRRTPLELTTGDTPDISEYIAFHIYQPIWYHQPTAKYPESKPVVGRWMGPAHSVGQLLSYKILQSNAKIVVRSTVQKLDTTSPSQNAALLAYNQALHTCIRLRLNDYNSANSDI